MSPRNWIMAGDVSRVMIPTAIFPRLVLGVPAARVYAALAMRANNVTGLVDSTIKQIAEDAKMGTSQVSDGLSRLVNEGWVTKVRQGNSRQSNKYQMHAFPHAGLSGNPEGPAGDELPGNPAGSTEAAGQEASGNPEPSGNPDGSRSLNYPDVRPGLSGNPEQTLRKPGHPLVYPKTCLSKDLSTTSSASLPSESDELGHSLFGGNLAVVHELKATKSKSAMKQASGYSPEFEAFWAVYPKHVSKKPAFDSWKRAMKKTTPEVVMAAVSRYAAARQGQDAQYTAQATTWLNQERWEDEPVVAHKQASGGYRPWTNPTDQSVYDEEL